MKECDHNRLERMFPYEKLYVCEDPDCRKKFRIVISESISKDK